MKKSEPVLPPYGFMVEFQHQGALARARPAKWTEDAASWDAWIERVVNTISERVWPTFENGAWSPTAASRNSVAMTRSDLALMPEFQALHLQSVAGPHGLQHLDFLYAEDEADWNLAIARYCPELADESRFNLKKMFEHAIFDYAGRYLPETFKFRFQRPRAYQMSMFLEPRGPQFVHYLAKSANTPSLISGHAIQGLLTGCVVYEAISMDEEAEAHNRRLLQRWMTDVGDRRVMAGVHYPTDSLSSWIVAAEIVDYLFADAKVRPFLLEAIHESLLYKFLERRVSRTASYALPWKCLTETLEKPSSRSSASTSG